MEATDLSILSKEELIAKVLELSSKLEEKNNKYELEYKVREHKHNYAEDFGLVVSAPAQELFKELYTNPDVFNDEERDQILRMYPEAMSFKGWYDGLGWSVDRQVEHFKTHIVPQIRQNIVFYTSILAKPVEFNDRWLIRKLRRAKEESESLCDRLESIDDFSYGETTPFNLKTEIIDVFNKDNTDIANYGGTPIQLDIFFGELSNVKVNINQKGFRKYVMGNIIKNLHEHAFKEMDEGSYSPTSINDDRANSLGEKILILFSKIVPWTFSSTLKRPTTQLTSGKKVVKQVCVQLEKDKEDENRVNLIIKNNGKPFHGDVTAVFEKGIGEGDGDHIGLYSAKQFLKSCNATISMTTEKNSEYNVVFVINLPIYEL